MSANLAERPHWMNGLEAMNKGRPLAELNQDPAPIIAELRTGKNVPTLALELGVSHQALYEFLLRYAPEDWQSLQAARQLSRLDECEQVFDSPQDEDVRKDGIAVTRAREKSRMAQWHLERANRKLFGQKVDIEQNVNINQHLTVMLAPTGLLADRLNQAGAGVLIDAPTHSDNEDSVNT